VSGLFSTQLTSCSRSVLQAGSVSTVSICPECHFLPPVWHPCSSGRMLPVTTRIVKHRPTRESHTSPSTRYARATSYSPCTATLGPLLRHDALEMIVQTVDCQKILHCAVQHTRFNFSKCCAPKYSSTPANCRKILPSPSTPIIL